MRVLAKKPVSDQEIVVGCKAHKVEAMHALVDAYYDRVFRVAYFLSNDVHGAEDLTQETFTASFKSIRSFQGNSKLITWLVSILRHRYLKRRHRDRRMKTVLADVPPPAEDGRQELLSEVNGALERLDEEDRTVLLLYHYESLSYSEIAEAMDVPVGTIKSRLFNARRKLKDLLAGRHAL
jgi:RNA polymerase sigma-70 factor (ECF subfamily)